MAGSGAGDELAEERGLWLEVSIDVRRSREMEVPLCFESLVDGVWLVYGWCMRSCEDVWIEGPDAGRL